MDTIQNVVYFNAPGDIEKWEENCLPIGNGYMGASFFGGISHERVVLNEKTLWIGGPSPLRPNYYGGNRKNVYPTVKKIQQLLHDEKYDEAQSLLSELTCEGTGWGYGSYQLLCDMTLDFMGIEESVISDYRRSLDMDKSLYTCAFTADGVRHTREAFASYPDRVICIRLRCDKSGALNFRLSLDKRQEGSEIEVCASRLDYFGALSDNALRYHSTFVVKNKGGSVSADKDSLVVSEADEAVILFCAATDYSDEFPSYRSGIDPKDITEKILSDSAVSDFDALYKKHYDDYSELFGRVRLALNGAAGEPLPTDELIEKYRSGCSKEISSQLEALYFQFGRYMLISSSRVGSLPANLQGVWNESNCPAWCCDYHINVNLQMNYWGAYNTNLAETAKPLIRYLDKMREPGRITAKEYYGIESTTEHPENGWIAHTQANVFGWTAPGWDFYWGWSTAAVAWLMQNLWEYYEFTEDEEILRSEIYPIMRESAEFYSKWLIYDDKQDRLVSSPTYSPEHGPVSIGNTYEQSLIEQFYTDFIKASEILGCDDELCEKVCAQKEKLKPFRVGRWGQLMEWFEEDDPVFDIAKVQKNHRHISHLLALYPGKAINKSTPELMRAAIVTMNDRGDESTGWARAYKLNLWARTGDGNRAYKILRGLLSGCTFPNLFDFHPPFQLDGNFGGSAGIAELLLQSHEGYIEPLAALPDEWGSGSYSGLCARGGFELDVRWEERRIKGITIKAHRNGVCRLKLKDAYSSADIPSEAFSDGSILTFNAEEGGVYRLEF